jgi:hypothetical protein
MSEHLGARVVAFVANELEGGARAAAAQHLEGCAECRAEVRRVQAALAALAEWRDPPPLPAPLQQALLTSFAEQTQDSVVRPASVPRAVMVRAAATVVLALVCGLAGYALGRTRGSRPEMITQAPTMPLFMLLLEEQTWPDPTRPRSGYVEWAARLREADRLDRAEKLTDEQGWRIDSQGRVTRPAAGTRPPNVSGWFLVHAENYEAAINLARQGPHLRFGSVLVRQIE